MDDRFLLTTDGGHYENLGLVELLRHRVRTAVCIDASGDAPAAASLAAAITLAREELGIVITLHEPDLLIPGSTDRPLRGLAARLAERLSARAVITGDIRYPDPFDVPGGDVHGRPGGDAHGHGDGDEWRHHGTLIVVQAVLTPGMPYELHAYAAANAAFPNDSTSDQWFDHRQFDAYQTLGRHLGEQAAPRSRRHWPKRGPPPDRLPPRLPRRPRYRPPYRPLRRPRPARQRARPRRLPRPGAPRTSERARLTRARRVGKDPAHGLRHHSGLPPARRSATPGEFHLCLLTLTLPAGPAL